MQSKTSTRYKVESWTIPAFDLTVTVQAEAGPATLSASFSDWDGWSFDAFDADGEAIDADDVAQSLGFEGARDLLSDLSADFFDFSDNQREGTISAG
jgi:hypothetical protein